MKFLILSVITLSFALPAFASKKEEVKQKTAEAASAVVDYSKEQKEQFQKEMEDNLAAINTEIVELKSHVSEASGDAKKELNEKIAALESKQAELSKNLAKLKKSSGKAWTEMKTGVSKAWDVLSDSYKKAKAEFKDEK